MSTNDTYKKLTLKLWKTDGKIKRYHSRKSRRIISKVKAEKFLKAYVKVTYRNGAYNDGTYESKQELLEALSAFLE